MEEEYIVDDRIIIPDFIKQMNDDELDEFIEKKERELRENKRNRSEKVAAAVWYCCT